MNMLMIAMFALAGFIASALFTGIEIPMLKKHQFRQFIREEGPQSHLKKEGTPTMGGIAIVAALIVVTFAAAVMTKAWSEYLVMLAVTVLFAAIGFLDDYIKVAKKHNLGLRAWQKLVLQILFAAGLALYMANFSGEGTGVWIPFLDRIVDFGWLYVPFIAFVVVAMANSVNLTDGLDGLSSGVTFIVAMFFALAGQQASQGEPAIFSAILAGACLGFLMYNRFPAKLFMGDTGSMALGGALASAAIMMKLEFLLVIAGFVYVAEALSVIIQVTSFKLTGKRVFRMSPLHHHFEMGGMKETQVVLMFWGASLVLCLIAYAVFRI